MNSDAGPNGATAVSLEMTSEEMNSEFILINGILICIQGSFNMYTGIVLTLTILYIIGTGLPTASSAELLLEIRS